MVKPLDLAAMFEQLPMPLMIVDRQLRCVAANAAYLRLIGRSSSDLLGANVFAAFPNEPPAVATVRASFERVLASGEPDEVAAVATSKPGEVGDRVWSARHSPILDDGKVAFIVQEAIDLTGLDPGASNLSESSVIDRAKRVQATATHLDLQLRDLRDMFAQAPGFMCFLRGPEHVFEMVNPAYMQLVGHRNVIGMTARDSLPEVVEQGFIELLDGVYRTGEAFRGEDLRVMLQRFPGSPLEEALVDFIYQPIRGRTDEVVGIFVLGQDKTAQHVALEQRRTAEAERRFLIDVMPNQVWTSTPDGKLDFVSARVEAYFQRSAQQILGDGWIAVLHPDDVAAVVTRWTRSLATGEPYEVEFRLRRGDGEYRWHLGRANAERDAAGAITKWVGTNTDVHDAKSALAELTVRSQYEQRLIGIVSHDLRNPFNAISLGTALLAQRALDPAAERLVTKIARAADRATRLITDLLDFATARIGTSIPVNPKPTNLKEIVEHVVDEFEFSAPGRIAWVGHTGAETGAWDQDRLAQVISNLLGNALQHGKPGAPVEIHSAIRDDGATLTIANEGAGIPPSELPKLFEPYRRSSAAGATRGSMGLGLYISREVIAAHGGTIEVESVPDASTRVTVRLPRFVSGAQAASSE